jgi:hypothetical protein
MEAMRWIVAVEGGEAAEPSEPVEAAEPDELAEGLVEVVALGVRVEPGVAIEEPVVGAVEKTEADALEELAPPAPEEPDGRAKLAVWVEPAELAGPVEPVEPPDGGIADGLRGGVLTCRPSRWF